MSLQPAPALAFLQLDAQSFACIESALSPASGPPHEVAAFLAPHFSLAPAATRWWSAAAPVGRLTREEWSDRFPATPERVPPLSWEPPDEARFRSGFESLRALLCGGQLRKGVPVTRMRARLPDDEAAWLFRALLARVPDLPAGVLAYGLFLPAAEGSGPEFMIGATPELLFEVLPGHRLRTQAVAGTRKAGPGAEEALAASGKDAAEHRAVVDDLLREAARWGTTNAGPAVIRRFGSLLHLVTEIEVETAVPVDFDAVAAALHPTPALGVAPRTEAGGAWLKAIDPAGERRRFGAPFGLRWPSGDGRAVVAIRNLQYARGHVEIWAGAGVVGSSEYTAEWDEILDKMQAVRTQWGV